jgi:hypothetical protein
MSDLLGAQKHLETCAACNYGRTPCTEYISNYGSPAAPPTMSCIKSEAWGVTAEKCGCPKCAALGKEPPTAPSQLDASFSHLAKFDIEPDQPTEKDVIAAAPSSASAEERELVARIEELDALEAIQDEAGILAEWGSVAQIRYKNRRPYSSRGLA